MAESSSQVFRCIIISVGVVLFPDYYGVLVFGIGRVSTIVVIVVVVIVIVVV